MTCTYPYVSIRLMYAYISGTPQAADSGFGSLSLRAINLAPEALLLGSLLALLLRYGAGAG